MVIVVAVGECQLCARNRQTARAGTGLRVVVVIRYLERQFSAGRNDEIAHDFQILMRERRAQVVIAVVVSIRSCETRRNRPGQVGRDTALALLDRLRVAAAAVCVDGDVVDIAAGRIRHQRDRFAGRECCSAVVAFNSGEDAFKGKDRAALADIERMLLQINDASALRAHLAEINLCAIERQTGNRTVTLIPRLINVKRAVREAKACIVQNVAALCAQVVINTRK